MRSRFALTMPLMVAGLAALPGCKTTNPEAAAVVAQPDTPVVKNITSFSNSLRCMDELFLDYGKRGIVITSDGLPDATGTINAGTKDMMITTLSKMSERSNAFRFVDIHSHGALNYIQKRTGENYDIPGFLYPWCDHPGGPQRRERQCRRRDRHPDGLAGLQRGSVVVGRHARSKHRRHD